MRTLILLFVPVLIFSCSKDKGKKFENSPAAILKANTWFLSESHLKTFDSLANRVTKDTIFLSDSCKRDAFIRFFTDSVCFKKMSCILSGSTEIQGKWYLSKDSFLFAYVPVRLSYGTGYILVNRGIELSKLLQINSDYFIIKHIKHWYAWDSNGWNTWTDTTISTFKRK